MTKIEASNLLFDIGHNCKSLEDDFSLSEALRQLEHYVEETEESYWHTGEPVEEGDYLIYAKIRYKNSNKYGCLVWNKQLGWSKDIIAWHKIPDFKEEE